MKIANENAKKLNAEVEQLKNEVFNTKINEVVEYNESNEYHMALGYIAVTFLAKTRIKMRRILRRAHNINRNCLEGIDNVPISSSSTREEVKEGKEMEQVIQPSDPSKQSP